MNTATTVLNGVTLTVASENNAGATKVDLTALTVNDIVLEATATNGSIDPGSGRYVDVYYAFGTASTTSNIPDVYGATAQKFRILLSDVNSAVKVYLTDVVTKKAQYIYVWYSHEPLDQTVTLTLKVVS